MKYSLTKYYNEEKKRVLEKCKECGICAKKCPIIKTTELADVSPKEIQEQIKAYLKNGDGTVRGIDGEISILPLFGNTESLSNIILGGSWINRYQTYTGIVEDYPTTVESYAARLQLDNGFFNLYTVIINKGTFIYNGKVYSGEM